MTTVALTLLVAICVSGLHTEYIPGTSIRVLSAQSTLSAPAGGPPTDTATTRRGKVGRRKKGTFWFAGDKFADFGRKDRKFNFTNKESMLFNRQAYELAFGDEFNFNDPFAELGEEFGEGFGPAFGDFTKVQRMRRELAKKQLEKDDEAKPKVAEKDNDTHEAELRRARQEVQLASKPKHMGDDFPKEPTASPAPSVPPAKTSAAKNKHHKASTFGNDFPSPAPTPTHKETETQRYQKDTEGNYHLRRGKLDKTEMPMTCTCKKGAWGRGTCYYFTDESIGACNRRDCLPKYVCVAPSRHGIQCMRRKMATRIVAIGLHKCVRKASHQMQYVPYTVS